MMTKLIKRILLIGAVVGVGTVIILSNFIYIKKASHLDADRKFISDIYDQVYQRDHRWSEVIPVGNWVRIVFEKKLDSTKKITVMARVADECVAIIEVYEKKGDQMLYEIDGIGPEDWYSSLLDSLEKPQDTFDLKITGCPVQFDYIYDPEGDPVGSFDTFADGSDKPYGLASDGTYIYVGDFTDDKIYVYDLVGNFQTSWDLTAGHDLPQSMDYDGEYLWIVDYDSDMVYKYATNGTYQSVSWAIGDGACSANNYPDGLATDGTNIWMADSIAATVFKYDMTGTCITSWSVPVANGSPHGATTNGTNIWIGDLADFEVYKYDMEINAVSNFDTAGNNNHHLWGIAIDNGAYLYVADNNDDEIYIYEGPGAPASAVQTFFLK